MKEKVENEFVTMMCEVIWAWDEFVQGYQGTQRIDDMNLPTKELSKSSGEGSRVSSLMIHF